MFYGYLAEKNSVIHLPVDENVVEAFLRFLYTDKCTTDAEIALKIISKLAKEYKVPSLEEKCWEVVDANVSKVINSSVFYSLDQEMLQVFLEPEFYFDVHRKQRRSRVVQSYFTMVQL